MGDDISLDNDERAIELSSISAIFPELETDPSTPFDARLNLQVAPVTPLKIQFTSTVDGAPPAPGQKLSNLDNDVVPQHGNNAPTGTLKNESDPKETYTLTFLPPVTVRIHLPDGYPAEQPPLFELSTSPPWLPTSKIQALVADGVRLWEEAGRDQVVFAYIDHIQQAAESAFELSSAGNDVLNISSDLKIALLDYDSKAKRDKFEQETFECGICLEPKKGKVCHRMLGCGHVFCVQCLQDCYNNSITEGEVDNVKCLEPSCGREPKQPAGRGEQGIKSTLKKRRKDLTLNPSELLQIPLEQEVVQRYVRLKRKQKLESDKSTVYCPRQWCQGAARSKKHPKPLDPISDDVYDGSEEEEEPPTETSKVKSSKDELPPISERLCICEDCSYAFCSVCKKGWHGELEACNPRKQAELNAEEKASEEYLKLHSSACPTCSAPCQKTMGCNHMICFKCRTHFCYLCGSFLMEDNPYEHFNNLKSTCYMRLWELEGGDGDQVDHRFHGGVEQWLDEESDEDADLVHDADTDDDASVHSGNTDDLPDGPNWFFPEVEGLDLSDDESSEDDVWEPGAEFQERQAHNNNPNAAVQQEPRIEIINFARAGVANPRLFPIQNGVAAAAQPPPHAPNPPRRRRNRNRGPNRRADRENRNRAPIDHAPIADLAAEIAEEENERMERAVAAPGQRRDAAMQPAPVRAMGLERFLEMAANDMEDEWDSDELDEDFEERNARHERRGRW